MNKVHIIDGNNFYSRHYFTNATTLSQLVGRFVKFRSKNKGRIIFTFDTSKSERRLNIFPEYKAGRKSHLTPEQYEQFKATLGHFINLVRNMGFSVVEGNGYEADDYIAILSKMLKAYHVFIHSTDQDFLQLITPTIHIVKTNKEGEQVVIDHENFAELVGVPKEFFLDYKCIVGDKGDNITGVDGIGETYAAKYINDHGTFEEIIKMVEEKLKETKKKNQPTKTELKFIEGKENFSKARELIDLSLVYVDSNLKNLVREKVKNTSLSLENCLEILSDVDCEDAFDAVKMICKASQS